MLQGHRKITIIGAGHVGSLCGLALAWHGICKELVLVDKVPKKATAQALDISDSLPFLPSATIVREGTYKDCIDSNITIIAIGIPRLPGQTRLDLLEDSTHMVEELLEELRPLNLTGLVITITNPADIVAEQIRSGLNMDRHRCFGTGTLLDTARLLQILSRELGISPGSITGFSLGEHGDSSMVAFSSVTACGMPLDEYAKIDKAKIIESTRTRGMDIINNKAVTEYGIGQSVAILCRTILEDDKRILPLSVQMQGEYGIYGIHCGVPCLIGKDGIEKIMELRLTKEEQAQLLESYKVILKHTELRKEYSKKKEVK